MAIIKNELFSALADPTRRGILKLLKNEDMNASDIAAQFNMTKPAMSFHLTVLKNAGLITGDKRGQNIIYSLNTTVMQEALNWFFDFMNKGGDEDVKDK